MGDNLRSGSQPASPRDLQAVVAELVPLLAAMGGQPLLVEIQRAAEMLSVSDRTVWSLTVPRGPIPCVRIGQRVLYSPRDLQQYIDSAKTPAAGTPEVQS